MPDRQFYGAIIWYHLMAPFYGMCVPGFTTLGQKTRWAYSTMLLSLQRADKWTNSVENNHRYWREFGSLLLPRRRVIKSSKKRQSSFRVVGKQHRAASVTLHNHIQQTGLQPINRSCNVATYSTDGHLRLIVNATNKERRSLPRLCQWQDVDSMLSADHEMTMM